MAVKDFEPLLNQSSTPAPRQKLSIQTFFLKDAFTLPTLLALGGLTQALFTAILPARYAILPLAFLLGRAIITTLLSARRAAAAGPSDPLAANIIHGRATAQLPLSSPGSSSGAGSFGHTAAATGVVAFHLGISINHPLGHLAPGGKAIGEHFRAMMDALHEHRDEFGLLSTSAWRGGERASGNAMLHAMYFRDVEGLNRFAHSATHRAGWDWYLGFVRETGYRHFGIFHETFAPGKGGWETVYVDVAPTLLGAASARVGGKEGAPAGEESWAGTLVSADHPALKTQSKRMDLTQGLKEANSEM